MTVAEQTRQLKKKGGMTLSNPFRKTQSMKKTQYMDQKAISMQKKLSVIDKVSMGRTNTGKALSPRMMKK